MAQTTTCTSGSSTPGSTLQAPTRTRDLWTATPSLSCCCGCCGCCSSSTPWCFTSAGWWEFSVDWGGRSDGRNSALVVGTLDIGRACWCAANVLSTLHLLRLESLWMCCTDGFFFNEALYHHWVIGFYFFIYSLQNESCSDDVPIKSIYLFSLILFFKFTKKPFNFFHEI